MAPTEHPDQSGSIPASEDKRWLSHRRKQWLFRFAAILVGFLPFVVLELGLRLFGIGDPTSQRDPLAGFSRQHPLFERSGDHFRTVRSREPFFGRQTFAVQKSTNEFRIFCFGGSTVYGHPYLNTTAFPAWLGIELAGRDPSRRFEVINCGGVSYASYRLAPILHEVLAYQPDLIILAMGHNEFLEDRTFQNLKSRSSAWRWLEDSFFSLHLTTCARKLCGLRPASTIDLALAPEVKPRLDDEAEGYASYHRDEGWRQAVLGQFEATLRGMIGECRAANVPVMIVTLGSNLRDCPPFKSEHRAGLTADAEARWQSLFDAAGLAEESEVPRALELYRQAEVIDGEYALLAYRIARCHERLGQFERAREFFIRAKDQDVCPLRMLEAESAFQHQIAGEARLPLVDACKLLASLDSNGIPGNDVYVDHVHPTIGGHQRIARAIADKLVELKLARDDGWSPAARVEAYQRHIQKLEPTYFSNGRRRVAWLENWARRHRLDQETLPKDAPGFLRQGFRALDLDEAAAAGRAFRKALALDPALAKPLAAHLLELRRQGRIESANRFVNQLSELAAQIQAEAQRLKESHGAAN